ncbi:MAG: family 78 glycoside hydrolase catalytic domain [Clostridiales bacterium]|nr:family 78 glycoside hydrolase catalytic domain [Clostridiales bacterium]
MKNLKILSFTADGMAEHFVTDTPPRFSFCYEGNMTGAKLSVAGACTDAMAQIAVPCPLAELKPFTDYTAVLTIENESEQDSASFTFRTGRMDTPWQARWITDGEYIFKEKKVSPQVMTFRKVFETKKAVAHAEILATALGIYELKLNGKKVGHQYFAPGFTSYKHHLQYQRYDVTAMLQAGNTLTAEVAGGWAVGSFVFTRANRITAPRQALLLELRLTYADGSVSCIGTDESWDVTLDGPVKLADLYDGETYDARVDLEQANWHRAACETVRIHPAISAQIGLPVVRRERFEAHFMKEVNGRLIYDFGQNFAGIVRLKIRGKAGQKVTVRHAEILKADGDLHTAFLRSAKATLTYICREGEQEYAPRFTYMGFRYISIEGARREELEVCAWAVYSDIRENGSFSCSNALLNRLNENIRWGARSNFVEIPTDCPQRDERMGWTGDIAVFAPTAVFNFDMTRFLEKWLRDLRSEQLPTGGIPNTIPAQGYGFPATMPNMAVDFWDDACILVPWAVYMASGDIHVLEEAYDSMERYVKACKFWANLVGFGKQRYIWHTPSVFHFGDWVAPDVPQMSQWQARSKWTATASLCNTSAMLSRISALLGKQEKAAEYRELSRRVADAYQSLLMDEDGKLKKQQFQTGYVLPLYFGMLDEPRRKAAAAHLAKLVEDNDCCIGTGFPGTPYILFALLDNGYADTAYRMLMNTKSPSWLYEVRVGATTIWERWDGLDENGLCPIGDDGTGGMISYNHYASGAVGDFLYRRVAGLEPISAGYREFRVQPFPGGGLTWAKAEVMTPYGKAASGWEMDENHVFTQTVTVPAGTVCTLIMPSGKTQKLTQGTYTVSEPYQRGE